MEKRLIVYKDGQPVMKFFVSPENSLADIEASFPDYKVTIYNEKKRLIPYNYDKITNGKILLTPVEIVRENILTGIKDVDLKILSDLDDRDLFNFCLSNQEAAGLCRDENFWRNRFYQRYGSLLEEAPELKPKEMKWKTFYMSVIMQLDSFQKNAWVFMNAIRWDLNTDTYNPFISAVKGAPKTGDPESDPKMWLLNLGETVELKLPIDRYEDLDPFLLKISAKTYGEPYLNPIRVLKSVYQFYQESINLQEFEAQQEIDNPYAENYTEEQVEAGKVIRKDMIGERFYEGFMYAGKIRGIENGKTRIFPQFNIILET